ncbi:MAG: DUF4399 domain-containing protein [Pseudomonadota bacterium]
MHNPNRYPIVATLGLLCAFSLTGCSPAPEAQKTAEPAAAATTPAEATPAPGLPRTAAPDNASVYFVTPADGDTLSSPVSVTFGAENVGIAPAGTDTPATGHHHLVINAPLPPEGLPIPKNDQYQHFGGGQTETTVELEPGTYKLTLVLGDHLHIPHEPMIYSETITITVTE